MDVSLWLVFNCFGILWQKMLLLLFGGGGSGGWTPYPLECIKYRNSHIWMLFFLFQHKSHFISHRYMRRLHRCLHWIYTKHWPTLDCFDGCWNEKHCECIKWYEHIGVSFLFCYAKRFNTKLNRKSGIYRCRFMNSGNDNA